MTKCFCFKKHSEINATNIEKMYSLPCCCAQDGGVVKSIRDPHASQAMVSISTLIQPLLAQLTALIACQGTQRHCGIRFTTWQSGDSFLYK